MIKRYKHIVVREKTIEPKWWTVIFEIEGKYKKYQCAAYDLEEAVKKASTYIYGVDIKNLLWHFSNSIEEIKRSFKNCT